MVCYIYIFCIYRINAEDPKPADEEIFKKFHNSLEHQLLHKTKEDVAKTGVRNFCDSLTTMFNSFQFYQIFIRYLKQRAM